MDFLVDQAGTPGAATAHELTLVLLADLPRWLEAQDAPTRAWVAATGFKAERHQVLLLPSADGTPRRAALGLGALPSLDALELWHVAGLPDRLPAGTCWRVTNELTVAAASALALGWAYGSYRFDTYKSSTQPATARARLIAAPAVDHAHVLQLAGATTLARDLVNTPASDMTPERLAAEAIRIAREYGAVPQEIAGDELRRGFPAIHAVGQASPCAPRLVDFVWGDPTHPTVTLIGKGVCFDTGGLDIKQ